MTATPGNPRSSAELAERLAAEMADAWRQGERVPAEDYLRRHPELLSPPDGAVWLIYEEVCLRQERGETVAGEELARRFPNWANELVVLLDCHQLMRAQLAPPEFVEVGESLGGFRLIAELGRGKQGRVFLATQRTLADRPVVLKVTPRHGREFLSLARLQHTHIIPLHGVHDFPARNLRVLCQPYLGGATLARLLDLLRPIPPERRTGRSLVEALDRAAAEAPFPLPGRGRYRDALAHVAYPEALCSIGACLADGLQHAHERGLVHLDLKSCNVLLAADGQPLLLDFHLALHPLRPGQSAPDWFGGTPEYMSPEQARACAAAGLGTPVPEAIDGRSDVYSLGYLLYLAMSGQEMTTSLQRLHHCNPQVSVGLSDIVHRCLAANPEGRYRDAAALATDLRRHLAHLPLRGVPNRSLRERWRKFNRRRPGALLGMGMLFALLAAGFMLGVAAIERYRDALSALAEGNMQLRQGAPHEAVRTLSRGRARVDGLPGSSRLAEEIDARLRQARRAQAAADLHSVAEKLRFLAGADLHSPRDLQVLEAHCRTTWAARGLAADRTIALDADTEEQMRQDLFDLVLLWADLKRRLAQSKGTSESQQDVGTVWTDAEVSRRTAAPGSWEHLRLIRSLLRLEDLDHTAEELEQALVVRPQDFWVNFHGGVCAYRREQYADAVYYFGVAIVSSPSSAEVYYNRGLAYTAWGENRLALRDYDRALALAPHLGVAALNRAVLYLQEGRIPQAKEDLEKALVGGADAATVHYNLALVQLRLSDRAAAEQHLQHALTDRPTHADALALRDRLRERE